MADNKEIEILLTKRLKVLKQKVELLDRSLQKPHSQNFSEQAVEREADEVKFELEHEAISEISTIQKALFRLESGAYGSCSHCGEEIPPGRLQALPYIISCIRCEKDLEAGGSH